MKAKSIIVTKKNDTDERFGNKLNEAILEKYVMRRSPINRIHKPQKRFGPVKSREKLKCLNVTSGMVNKNLRREKKNRRR